MLNWSFPIMTRESAIHMGRSRGKPLATAFCDSSFLLVSAELSGIGAIRHLSNFSLLRLSVAKDSKGNDCTSTYYLYYNHYLRSSLKEFAT